MKLVVLKLDDSISQISFCEDPSEDIKNFSRTITGTFFDKSRDKARIEIFDISPSGVLEFTPTKVKHGKELITRFEIGSDVSS